MGRMNYFMEQIKQSRLLAPNLKEMTLKIYTGNKYPGNRIARHVLRDHLLALRWMNPNAVIYLQENRGQGPASISYRLWKGPDIEKQFEITKTLSPEEVIAKVLMAARDPEVNDLPLSSLSSSTTAGKTTPSSSSTISPSSTTTTTAATTSVPPSQQQTRSYSTLNTIKELSEDTIHISTPLDTILSRNSPKLQ